MSIKDNLRQSIKSSLNKLAAEGGDALKAKQLVPKEVRSAYEIEEGHDCKKIHPEMTHEDWQKGQESEMEEATTAASSGAFIAPLGYDPRFTSKKKEKKEEMEEATTAASSGQYATPFFLAKNLKNWRGKAKTQWPGGKFVKIKDKCKTFPYCNQGDINALELTENEKIKNAINEVSKKTGKSRDEIKKLVKKEMEEIIRRSIYKSPITSLVGTGKMKTPIGKIYTMGSNVGGKYE
tara:strand:- start:345 stop:1052 length:708 start_codon:yes stop_codon:yes gene_type:complete